MNIFEGARRIAKLIVALIVVGFGFAIVYDSPSPVSVSYLIAGVAKPPVRVEQCEVGVGSRTKEITSKSAGIINATLCFKFIKYVTDPVLLAQLNAGPYDPVEKFSTWVTNGKPKSSIEIAGRVLSDQDYSGANEATKIAIKASILKKYKVNLDDLEILYSASPDTYASVVLDAFQIPKADEGYITRLEWFQRAQSAGLYLLGMFASLAGFWLFVWTVGWIVRGFKGIPQGRDSEG